MGEKKEDWQETLRLGQQQLVVSWVFVSPVYSDLGTGEACKQTNKNPTQTLEYSALSAKVWARENVTGTQREAPAPTLWPRALADDSIHRQQQSPGSSGSWSKLRCSGQPQHPWSPMSSRPLPSGIRTSRPNSFFSTPKGYLATESLTITLTNKRIWSYGILKNTIKSK